MYRNTVPVADPAPIAYDVPESFSECRSSRKVPQHRVLRVAGIVAEIVADPAELVVEIVEVFEHAHRFAVRQAMALVVF